MLKAQRGHIYTFERLTVDIFICYMLTVDIFIHVKGSAVLYSKTSIARTLIDRLPRLVWLFLSPLEKNHIAADLR